MIEVSKKIVGVNIKKKEETEEEIISESVLLPDDSPARMKVLRAEGRKWYLTVVYHKDTEQPFALFCYTNSREKTVQTSDAIDKLLALAKKKKIPKKYIKETQEKCEHDANTSKITRVISLLLRHGVLMKNIVQVLDKMDDIYVGSFLFQLKKFMSNYIHDGEIVEEEVCSECGGNLVYVEGCYICRDCGMSKCG